MASVVAAPPQIETVADLIDRLGGVDPRRIRFRPPPGMACVQDVIDLAERRGKLCELVDGVLLEKVMGLTESNLAVFLAGLLNAVVIPRNLGFVTGADGATELMPDLVRIPDVAFVSWDRTPNRKRPTAPVPRLAPNLVVEVLSSSNTPGEMASKRRDYFAAGVERVWEVDPDTYTVAVYSAPTKAVTLGVADTLDGETVVPGFSLPVATLFAELDRQG